MALKGSRAKQASSSAARVAAGAEEHAVKPLDPSLNVADSSRDAWRACAAYLYILGLDAPALAWEYLRRNAEYRADWMDRRRTRDAAARWRLGAFEDPSLDGRNAQPLWRPRPDDVVHLVALGLDAQRAERFSLWPVPGHKRLCHDGTSLLLQTTLRNGTARVAIPDGLSDGRAFAYVAILDAQAERRWREIKRTHRLLRPEALQATFGAAARLDRGALTHLRSLHALDGAHAGASQRAIAAAVVGPARIYAEWRADCALRSQVRHWLRRGRLYSEGGYVQLLGGEAGNPAKAARRGAGR
jgi:hypothetical protein